MPRNNNEFTAIEARIVREERKSSARRKERMADEDFGLQLEEAFAMFSEHEMAGVWNAEY